MNNNETGKMPEFHGAALGPRTLPIISIPCVYHLGNMLASERSSSGDSLEGHALSVSTTPHAWQEIAKLGGRSLHELRSENGQFVDALAVLKIGTFRDELQKWAQSQGLVRIVQRYRAWFYDSEVGDWRYLVKKTEDKAWAEIDCSHLQGEFDNPAVAPSPEGNSCVEPIEQCVGTPALEREVGRTRLSEVDATDMALLVFVDRHCPEADGLWWAEAYEPAALSAPRGGILPSRIGRWTASPVRLADVSDEFIDAPHFQGSWRVRCRACPKGLAWRRNH